MSRRKDRWGDDDERPIRRRTGRGMSPVVIVLIVLGSVFGFGALVCGGLVWVGHREARNVQAEQAAREAAELARAEAERRAAEAERGGGAANRDPFPFVPPNFPHPVGEPPAPDVPPPKPGSKEADDPPPQPRATAFPTDDPKQPGRWRVLFRSKKPELWNTNTQAGDDFALPLRSTPADTRYLRLRRMDTGEALIIPMTRLRIGRADPPGSKVRWNGEGKDEHGGYHLGIAEGPVARFLEGQGTIGVLMDGWDANPGSGFGHAHHIENGGQRYSWQGKELPPTAFEVAVTAGELTAAERGWLRE